MKKLLLAPPLTALPSSPTLRIALPKLYRFIVLERSRGNDVLRRMASRTEDRIRVALQRLHDLFALQVPDVHHVVLTARHDPLATGDGEVGKDAVLLVPMAGVRLQALALRIVPQLERVVERCRQNVLAVRRELHERYRRIVIVDQRLQTLAAGSVPDPAQPIVAGRYDQRPVPVEVNRRHRVGVSGQRLQTLARSHVPDAHGFVEAARHDQIALRVEVAAEHVVGVALQRFQTLARAQLPDFQRLVIAGRHEQTAIARPRHIADAELVAGDRLLELTIVGAPDFDQLVGRGACKPFPVRTELYRRHRLGMSGKGELEGVVWFHR